MPESEGGTQNLILMDSAKECLNEEDLSNKNPPIAETTDFKIQELTDEEAVKFQKELAMKCKQETSSIKERVTKNNENYEEEKDRDELELNPGNGCDLSNTPWIQTLSLAEEREFESVNEVDVTAFSLNATMVESLEKENPKNPLLLIPVIRCVLKFLNIEDKKNFRLVCREWGSTGKQALAKNALIRFQKDYLQKEPKRLPVYFQSCFLDSTSHFSAFKIKGVFNGQSVKYSWTLEELEDFFDEHQKYIKELTLLIKYPDERFVNKIVLSSWISKSVLVQKDSKHLTKLSVGGKHNLLDIRPLHLIAHIKDLSLSNCRIHVEAGIKICPLKLKLKNATFYQDGDELDQVQINDIVDLGKTKEVTLLNWKSYGSTVYVLDLWGSATFEKLILFGDDLEYENLETSQWIIEHLEMPYLPYGFNSQMNIKKLYLSEAGRNLDLSTLPTSIQKLALPDGHKRCSQPIVLQNLQYLEIEGTSNADLSFLSHFMNCPQLAHLKLYKCTKMELKSAWIPKSVKTLTLEDCYYGIKLLDENHWNLETLVVDDFTSAYALCEGKIEVEDFVVHFYEAPLDERLTDFLEHRERFGFGKRLYIGELKWKDKQLKESVLKELVDEKSAFYVFQLGQKGRAVSEKTFHDLFPKHLDIHS